VRHFILSNGKPIEVDERIKDEWDKEPSRRMVELTVIEDSTDPALVSTVFVGTDQLGEREGKMLLYETAMFGVYPSNPSWSSTTLGMAKATHFHVVEIGMKSIERLGRRPAC
jgi:hypothetical protein